MRWSYDIHQDGNQTSFHGNPLITDQLVLIGTDKSCASGGIGHVYAFDRATGAVRWKYRTAGTPTDIVRIGSTIYAAIFVDELSALNLADGTLRWRFATGMPNPDCALPPAPVVVGDRVVYAGLDGILYGFDAQSGKVLWKHDLGKRPTTKLNVINNSIYVQDGGHMSDVGSRRNLTKTEVRQGSRSMPEPRPCGQLPRSDSK